MKASGFVKQIEKELDIFLTEIDIEYKEKKDNKDIETDESSEEETYEDCVDNIEDLEYQLNDLQFQDPIAKERFDVPTKQTVPNNDNKHLKEISTVSCSDKQSNTKNECERNNEDVTLENVIPNEEYNDCTLYGLSNTKDKAIYVSDETRSVRSISTAATIAPDVIKKRTKLALDKRERSQAKRILVKGEASAVTRVRRDNRATIKESTGIWGWE